MVKMADVWDRTAEFLSDNVAAVLPVALGAFFVPASIQGSFATLKEGADTAVLVALYALEFGFALLQLWGSLAIAALALDVASERTFARLASRRLPKALAVSLAMFAAMLLMALPVPALLAANGVDLGAIARSENFEMSRAVAGTVAAYAIILVLVLLWLAARLSLVTAVVVRENRMFAAFVRSWRLTRGLALRIVGVILLYTVVSWVAQLAARTVFGSIFELVAGGAGAGISLSGVLTSVVVAAVQASFTLLAPAFTAKLYLALAAQAGFRQTASA